MRFVLAVICDRCVFEVDVIRGNVVEVDMIGGRYVPDVDVNCDRCIFETEVNCGRRILEMYSGGCVFEVDVIRDRCMR